VRAQFAREKHFGTTKGRIVLSARFAITSRLLSILFTRAAPSLHQFRIRLIKNRDCPIQVHTQISKTMTTAPAPSPSSYIVLAPKDPATLCCGDPFKKEQPAIEWTYERDTVPLELSTKKITLEQWQHVWDALEEHYQSFYNRSNRILHAPPVVFVCWPVVIAKGKKFFRGFDALAGQQQSKLLLENSSAAGVIKVSVWNKPLLAVLSAVASTVPASVNAKNSNIASARTAPTPRPRLRQRRVVVRAIWMQGNDGLSVRGGERRGRWKGDNGSASGLKHMCRVSLSAGRTRRDTSRVESSRDGRRRRRAMRAVFSYYYYYRSTAGCDGGRLSGYNIAPPTPPANGDGGSAAVRPSPVAKVSVRSFVRSLARSFVRQGGGAPPPSHPSPARPGPSRPVRPTGPSCCVRAETVSPMPHSCSCSVL